MLQIPQHLYESAAIDGAGEWRMFRRITLPLLRPVLALVLVVSLIGSFQIFDTVAVTTHGGPVGATRVIYYYIYQQAFTYFHMGYAAAAAIVPRRDPRRCSPPSRCACCARPVRTWREGADPCAA